MRRGHTWPSNLRGVVELAADRVEAAAVDSVEAGREEEAVAVEVVAVAVAKEAAVMDSVAAILGVVEEEEDLGPGDSEVVAAAGEGADGTPRRLCTMGWHTESAAGRRRGAQRTLGYTRSAKSEVERLSVGLIKRWMG